MRSAHAGMDKAYHVIEGEGLFLLEGGEVPMQAARPHHTRAGPVESRFSPAVNRAFACSLCSRGSTFNDSLRGAISAHS